MKRADETVYLFGTGVLVTLAGFIMTYQMESITGMAGSGALVPSDFLSIAAPILAGITFLITILVFVNKK